MRLLSLAALVALILDQLSKYVVVFAMDLVTLREIPVWPPLLTFLYGENTGINFGLFGGGAEATRWVLVGISLAVAVGVAIWISRQPRRLMTYLSAGLLIGGALGNVVDRVLYGYVLDFLNMSCCGIQNPFVFNVADIFIFAGAIGLILFEDRQTGSGKNAS